MSKLFTILYHLFIISLGLIAVYLWEISYFFILTFLYWGRGGLNSINVSIWYVIAAVVLTIFLFLLLRKMKNSFKDIYAPYIGLFLGITVFSFFFFFKYALAVLFLCGGEIVLFAILFYFAGAFKKGVSIEFSTCVSCGGTGILNNLLCPVCKGKGFISTV